MGLARCRLDIAVAEQLSDNRQAFANRQRSGREGMPWILSRIFRRPRFGAGFVSLAVANPTKQA